MTEPEDKKPGLPRWAHIYSIAGLVLLAACYMQLTSILVNTH